MLTINCTFRDLMETIKLPKDLEMLVDGISDYQWSLLEERFHETDWDLDNINTMQKWVARKLEKCVEHVTEYPDEDWDEWEEFYDRL